jgi:hypothetical protein
MKTNMTRFALLILLIASFMALIVACSDADVASNKKRLINLRLPAE